MKKLSAMLLVAVLACALCAPSLASEPEPVKIALFEPLSGTNAYAGELCLKGAQLAVKHVNENGGIKSLGGAKVELIVSDITSDSSQVKNVVERVLSQEGIVAATGTGVSALTIPILPVTEKLGIPILTVSIASGIADVGYQFVNQMPATGARFGAAPVEFLNWLCGDKDLDYSKVALLYENSSWGVSTADGTRDKLKNLGYEIVYDESFPSGLTDASSLVTKLKASGAQVLFCTAYLQEAKLIISTMKSMDCDALIIGGGSGFLQSEMADELGDKVNGLVSVSHWSYDVKNIVGNKELEAICEDYRKEYGSFMPQNGGTTYSCYMAIFAALEQSGSRDPKVIRDAVRSLKTETLLPFGYLDFDENGLNQNVAPVMIQWQEGEPHVVWPESAAGYAHYMAPSEF